MQLTLQTDFSLRTLIYVGLKPAGQLSTVNEVADVFGIPRNHLVKIAHRLGREGYLSTVRGKNGGIRLARPPAEINVGAVVRVIEPTLHPVQCRKAEGDCIILPACRLRSVLNDAMGAFMAVLDSYTLADVLHEPEQLLKLVNLARPAPLPELAATLP